MQRLYTFIGLLISSIVITATELTISWNNIQGVNVVTTAGQIIPLVIGATSFLRLFYLWLARRYGRYRHFGVEKDVPINRDPANPGDIFHYGQPVRMRRPPTNTS
jgi:hypothetical protein